MRWWSVNLLACDTLHPMKVRTVKTTRAIKRLMVVVEETENSRRGRSRSKCTSWQWDYQWLMITFMWAVDVFLYGDTFWSLFFMSHAQTLVIPHQLIHNLINYISNFFSPLLLSCVKCKYTSYNWVYSGREMKVNGRHLVVVEQELARVTLGLCSPGETDASKCNYNVKKETETCLLLGPEIRLIEGLLSSSYPACPNHWSWLMTCKGCLCLLSSLLSLSLSLV